MFSIMFGLHFFKTLCLLDSMQVLKSVCNPCYKMACIINFCAVSVSQKGKPTKRKIDTVGPAPSSLS